MKANPFTGCILMFILLVRPVFGGDPLMVKGRILNDQGPLKGALVLVKQGDEEVDRFNTNESGNFVFFLDYNNQYLVDFSKEGYFTKTITVDTRLPEKQSQYKKQLVSIELELIVNVTSEEESSPTLGEIYYNRTTKEFSYRSKYTGDVVTNIRMAGADYYDNAPEGNDLIDSNEGSAEWQASNSELINRKVEFFRKINDRRAMLLDSDSKLSGIPSIPTNRAGISALPDTTVLNYFHHGMQVTEIIITSNAVFRDYHKVVHDWGPIFYFKNFYPISRSIFDLETGLKAEK